MELFAHIGLTFGATALIDRFMPPRRSAAGAKAPTGWGVFRGQKVDFRLVMVGSLLPDIIDKPLGIYLLPLGNGRVYAHTLLFLLAMITLGILSFRWRKGLVVPTLAFGTLCHLLLDSMWAYPRTLFWPLLGPFEKGDASGWLMDNWRYLLTRPDYYIPEIIGLTVLLWCAVLILRRRQTVLFLKKGWFMV